MTALNKSMLLIIIALLSNSIYGQGCSDAGFCTVNTFMPNAIDSTTNFKHQLKVDVFYGQADKQIMVYGNSVIYSSQLNYKMGVEVKLNSITQTGNGISKSGLSDIFLTTNFGIHQNLKLTLGGKFPLSDANKSHNHLPLPMDYQSSLGTFDLIAGLSYTYQKLQAVIAIQQPISQNNNQFISSDIDEESVLSSFQSTKNYMRSNDILLRVSYPVLLNSKIKLTPSLLPIYHLTNDRYRDQNNNEYEIKDSKGLTLNTNLHIDYIINQTQSIFFNVAVPILIRESRPDGLTRSFVLSLAYGLKF
jgi:hypothetical protein